MLFLGLVGLCLFCIFDGLVEILKNPHHRVPENWGGMKLSYLSKKPLASWFKDTLNRVHFLREWNDDGPPMSFWVPGFYFPQVWGTFTKQLHSPLQFISKHNTTLTTPSQGFLTAVLQTHSRRFKIPIDELKFRSGVTEWSESEMILEEPSTGVYIHGLTLEGCRWDAKGKTLTESLPGELHTQFPVMWLEPIVVTESVGDPDTTYETPMYKTTTRAGTLSTTGMKNKQYSKINSDPSCHLHTPSCRALDEPGDNGASPILIPSPATLGHAVCSTAVHAGLIESSLLCSKDTKGAKGGIKPIQNIPEE